MIQQKAGEFSLSGLKRHTGEYFLLFELVEI